MGKGLFSKGGFADSLDESEEGRPKVVTWFHLNRFRLPKSEKRFKIEIGTGRKVSS